jgi:hypothetical protein
MSHHSLTNQLLGLNNPTSGDYQKITGYLGISVNVHGPEDDAVELKLATDE